MLGLSGIFADPRAARDLGSAAANTLRIASNVVSAEKVVIGADTYEVEIVNTDSLDDTAKGDFNNTTDALTVLGAVVTYSNITFTPGLFIKIGTEIMEVTSVDGNDVIFDRGVFGTTTATHADGTAIFTTVITDTDSTDDTAGGDFNNTTDALVVLGAIVTYPNVDFTVEYFIRIDSEIMEITAVNGNDVTLSRGAKSTAIVAHADSTAIFDISLGDADTTDNTQGGDFNNITDALTVVDAVLNYTNITFVVGQYLKIQTEIMEVTVVAGNDVTFARGALATSVATHADALDIFETTISYVDSTDVTAKGRFNTTDDALVILGAVVTYSNISFSNGVLIKVESEILEVTDVTVNDVTFDRAAKGTSTVVHADGLSIFVTTTEDTDSTDTTAKGRFNNIEDALIILRAVVTYSNITFAVGKLIRIQNEIMAVTAVDIDDVTFKRGVSGTTIATHADALDIFVGDGIVAGIAVGLVGTLTPTAFTPALVADINGRGSVSVLATQISVNEILVATSDVPGGTPVQSTLATATTETLGGANNAWDGVTLGDGEAPGNISTAVSNRVPTTQEVALGNMHFVLPFDPKGAFVTVFTTSTGLQVAWDGLITITGNIVTLDNGGATDWSTSETVSVMVTN